MPRPGLRWPYYLHNALLIRGIIARGDGNVTSLLADHLDILNLAIAHTSWDFR